METLFDRPVALSIGPQHCGTSWIQNYLQARGDVCLPTDVPEIFYFDRHFQRGPEFYAEHFNPKPHHKIIAELTTTAFDNPDAPSHVQKLLGADIRLICPLRHPVSRAAATYAEYVKYGLVRGGIEQAVELIPQILLSSRYADHLQNWITQFGANNVHILYYEMLEMDQSQYAADLCTAFGITFNSPAAGSLWTRLKGVLHTQKDQAVALSPRDQSWLKSRLEGEVSRLETLIKSPISYWK